MINTILKFYPLGNADTTLITINNDRHIIWDYANMKTDEDDDKRCDLPTELNNDVTGDFEVATFTHADNDHIKGFSEYFYLEHAKKYQDDNRKKIGELWVPSTVLIDTEAKDEAKILKAEARHRLKNKSGIKVFSRPDKMKSWCDNQDDISYEEVKHLFIDAGNIIPNYNKEDDGFEFFVHAPFASESQEVDRNGACIVVQMSFNNKPESSLILGADTTHEVWDDIVNVTKYFGNEDRLKWDLFHISHHCSYLSLSEEKGESKTEPTENIKWLFGEQGKNDAKLISSSKPIPKDGDETQPPHKQAAEYYIEVANDLNGEFIVTMEEPSKQYPKPFEITISDDGLENSKEKSKLKTLRSIAAGVQSKTLLSGKDGKLNYEDGVNHKDHLFHG